MGICTSKQMHPETLSGLPKELLNGEVKRPTAQHRTSITYIKPRDICTDEVALARLHVCEETEELELGGLKIRYAYMSQRGYYPDDENKPNQDTYTIAEDFANERADAFFAVFDGHGRDGDKCAQFAKKYISRTLEKEVKNVKRKQKAENATMGVESAIEVELNKSQVQKAMLDSHLVVNKNMHRNKEIEDTLSGTTAISAFFQGNRNRVTISNVGDSRAILGKRVDKPQGREKTVPFESGAQYRAVPLSQDQTPYRKGERQRILSKGARILSLDQIEGLQPVRFNEEGTDLDLGEEIDEGGDPPRVWHPTMDFPGTAFSRSIGDSLAEELGVIADPEMVTRELERGDEMIILASDGVFEFLTNQSVIDICASFKDPLEACQAVVDEAYELWLNFELRTDDITIICIYIDEINTEIAKSFRSRASIKNLTTDIPDNLTIDARQSGDVKKLDRRLTEMKSILHESLLDISDEGSVDLSDLYHEKTEAERKVLMTASRGCVMLQSMTPSQLREVHDVMQPVNVKKGDRVIKQGDEGDKFYIIEEGDFEVRVGGRDSYRNVITESERSIAGKLVHTYHASKEKKVHPSFGELALLYSTPRAASITATTDAKLWSLDRKVLKAIMLDGAGKKQLVHMMKNIPELKSFQNEEIEEFASAMEEATFNQNEIITSKDTEGDALYVISEGECEIELESGESATLDRLNFFGNEVASNEESKYLATVKAKSATVTCWKLDDKIISTCMRKMKAVMEGKTSLEEEE
ncbi:protein kinase A [Chaetoceros tenuissimus]|uniref:Protein kinase A n=1 Tax=Chaetoceros tenuissimus TaxID=426638 RepID=A0AAD3H7W3_9STRA|nr:protein kinase A [Chaetoceros tenuissimus]